MKNKILCLAGLAASLAAVQAFADNTNNMNPGSTTTDTTMQNQQPGTAPSAVAPAPGATSGTDTNANPGSAGTSGNTNYGTNPSGANSGGTMDSGSAGTSGTTTGGANH